MAEFMTPAQNAIIAPSGPIWLSDDGIIITINNKQATHSLENAIENLRITKLLAGDKARPLLVDMTDVRSMDRVAREAYVNPENKQFICAVALLTRSNIGRVIANIFMNVQKTVVPVKLFNDPVKAKEWLMQFLLE